MRLQFCGTVTRANFLQLKGTNLPKTFSNTYLLTLVDLDREDDLPIYRQLYNGLRQAIISGRLEAGVRLPSSRDMAQLFSVSRNTILDAIGQLIAEGYLDTRQGSGTYITHNLPEELMELDSKGRLSSPILSQKRTVSNRGSQIATMEFTPRRKTNPDYVFTIGMPAVDIFPFNIWSRLTSYHYRNSLKSQFDYQLSDGAGYYPLREAIAHYLNTARAMQCKPHQVIICNGSQHGLYIASRVLLDPGDKAWIENPGYLGARWVLSSANAEIVPINVDEHGLRVEDGIQQAPDARLAYVTPSLQFPIGCMMNLKRRSDLLNWANHSDAWIIEDDYDHEFRYEGNPLMSLQGLDASGRVIYIGTFSKVLFPGLRIGYLVVPEDLVEVFTAARTLIDLRTTSIPQLVLNDFIRGGHFTRHIRRARSLYAQRREHFLKEVEEQLGDIVSIGSSVAGMHIVLWLPDHISDEIIFHEMQEQGIETLPISRFHIGTPQRSGLIMGYAAASEDKISDGIEKLSKTLNKHLS